MTEQKIDLRIQREKVKQRLDDIKKKSKRVLIRNEIFGYIEERTVKEALDYGAVVFRNGRYLIPTEERIITVDDGKALRYPKKVVVVSRKYFEFIEKLKGKSINSYA